MKKIEFPSLKTLDQFKSLRRSPSGAAKSFSFAPRPSSDSISAGSFVNLKLAAERLVKEQATVKTELEIVNSKLKKTMEDIRVLESKLQNSLNENANLKVKQKEDQKLWKGLESKFSSTKSLCDQLTETLQHLASQVQNAEKDREFFEGKLSESSKAIDCLSNQLDSLLLKLGAAEESIRNREKELEELKIEKEERKKSYQIEQCRVAGLLEEKDAMIRQFEATIEANKLEAEHLNSRLEEVDHQLVLKENEIRQLAITQENLNKDKSGLQLSNLDLAKQLATSVKEIGNLEGFVNVLTQQLGVLDKKNLDFIDKFDKLNALYDSCFKLVRHERDLAAKHADIKYKQLHSKFLCVASEKDALQLVTNELSAKFAELQKAQESVLANLSEECRLAGEKIQRLESEAEGLRLKKTELEKVVSELEGSIGTLSETSRLSKNKVQDLLSKISSLEIENKDNVEKMQTEILLKTEEIDNLKKASAKHELHEGSLEKQVDELHKISEEKEESILKYKERERELEEQVKENHKMLATAESRLIEAKKQHDQILEGKQLELSRHLKEISQRNDQAINDIRRRYDVEKQEIVHAEREKADKAIEEVERKCEQKIGECKESEQLLVQTKEEHAAQITRIQQGHDEMIWSLKFDHSEELKRFQLQADDELNGLRERLKYLRNEHETQLKALRCQFEDERQRLQEELDLQKSREERQRALLHLHWKVMGDNPQDDKVDSKQEYLISSVKMRDTDGRKRSQRTLARTRNEEKESPVLPITQTPMSKLLKRVEIANPGNGMNTPKHHKKVTHHEYEVETTNGRTITKRRKMKSTVMFEDPRKEKKNAPQLVTPSSFIKGGKGDPQKPSTIGDLFSEGSLNPYTDDPYAFD